MSKRSPSEPTKQQSSLVSFFQPPSKRSKTSPAAANSTDATTRRTNYIIYCDLDGVLVDFDAGVKKIFPKSPSDDDIPSKVLWPTLAKTPRFYQNLPWMSDGRTLWNTLLHIKNSSCSSSSQENAVQLRILTGCPMFSAAATDKYVWCRRELGVDTVHIPKMGPKQQQRDVLKQSHAKVQVITCRSKEKKQQSGKGCILIDDRLALKDEWEQQGGMFIHHVNTESTLQHLRDKGILTSDLPTEETASGPTAMDPPEESDAQMMTTSEGFEELYPSPLICKWYKE